MHSASTAKAEVAWCAQPATHAITVDDGELAAGRLHASTFVRALECFQRCGFVKLRAAVDTKFLADIDEALRALLRDTPNTPLLARLRPSEPLDNVTARSGFLNSLGERLPWASVRPWEQDAGRAMVDMPYARPFNASALSLAPLLMPLVEALLGHSNGASLGVVVEQAAHIMVGPHTGAQQVHTDATHFTSQATDAGVLDDATALAEQAGRVEPAFAAILASQRQKMDVGNVTYALNVQLPLQDVETVNGPTALCPATHSEVFCRRFLRGVCLPQAPKNPPPKAIEAMEAYVRLSGLCTHNSTRVYGTAHAGDALLYDSRIIHWGSENRADLPRHLISFTYAHAWYTETGRDLRAEAVEEAVGWRYAWGDEWRHSRRSSGLEIVGAISAEKLREMHTKLRMLRDAEERRQWLFFGVGMALVIMYFVTHVKERRTRHRAKSD